MWSHLVPMIPLFLREEDSGGGGGTGTKDKPKGESKPDPSKKESESEDDGKKKTPTEQLTDENNSLKREAAERDRKDREAEQERLKTAGKHEERANKAEARNKELEEEIESLKKGGTIREIAEREGMEHPADAVAFLTDEEKKDDRSIEEGIRRLQSDRPKLFTGKKRSGGDVRTHEEVPDPPRRRDEATPPGLGRLRSVQRKTT